MTIFLKAEGNVRFRAALVRIRWQASKQASKQSIDILQQNVLNASGPGQSNLVQPRILGHIYSVVAIDVGGRQIFLAGGGE